MMSFKKRRIEQIRDSMYPEGISSITSLALPQRVYDTLMYWERGVFSGVTIDDMKENFYLMETL